MVIGVFVGPATAAPADQSTERIRAAAGRALAALPSRRYPAWSGGFGSWPGPWPGVLAASRNSMATVDLLLQLERGVQSTIAMSPSLYRRPTDLEGIAPSQLDSRSASMVRNKVAFALASCDVAQADVLRTKGVELAMISAWRGDAAATAKALDMLAAFADRSPFQRPGWSLTDDSIALPAGGDGVWLATAWGIGGIADMVGLMGDRIPADLRSRLDQAVRAELERIVTDWADARPWYVKGRDVASNQWIEPCVAMVRACLHLRDPALGPAYDLAVENLGLSIAAQGADGAFMEGLGYAEQTCGPLTDCLTAMHTIGDPRLRSEPWSTKAWAWFLHMNLVGGAVLNSHDCRMSQRPDWAMRTPMPSEVSVLLGSGDPAAIDAGMFLFPQGSATLPGIRWSTAIAQRPAAPMRLPRSLRKARWSGGLRGNLLPHAPARWQSGCAAARSARGTFTATTARSASSMGLAMCSWSAERPTTAQRDSRSATRVQRVTGSCRSVKCRHEDGRWPLRWRFGRSMHRAAA
jgi:hypothetical protein